MNAGMSDGSTTEPGTAALVTYTGGDWTSGTDIYIAPIGADMTEAVVGRFASLYHDGDTTPTTNQYLVARITVVNAGTRSITLSTTARSLLGTEVATGTGNRSMKIGGAWAHPATTNGFPVTFIGSGLVNAAGAPSRLNVKNDAALVPTASWSRTLGGLVVFESYTAAFGDTGRNTLGTSSGASFNTLVLSGTGQCGEWRYFDFVGNGATGNAAGVSLTTGTSWLFHRCSFRSMKGHGLSTSNATVVGSECEFDSNGSSGINAGLAPIILNWCRMTRNGSTGYSQSSSHTIMNHCTIADNGSSGIAVAGGFMLLDEVDIYGNAASGILCSTGSPVVYIRNCNVVLNGDAGGEYGLDVASGVWSLWKTGWGSGTQANFAGNTNGNVDDHDPVTYTANVTPWADPVNGNFTVRLPAAIGTGRGEFLQSDAAYDGTVGYPDIGAAPANPAASGGITSLGRW